MFFFFSMIIFDLKGIHQLYIIFLINFTILVEMLLAISV